MIEAFSVAGSNANKQTSLVVDAEEHALLARHPKARYVVGNDARFLFVPITTMLNEWLADRLLSGPRPKPRVLQRKS